jgi:DNA polymerase I-like protein with 3'-5' exonuclease and polymerase domains
MSSSGNLTVDAAAGAVKHTPSAAVRLVGHPAIACEALSAEKHWSYEQTEAWYTDCMISSPSRVPLPATKRYAARDVIWLAGHHIFGPEPVASYSQMTYGPSPCKYFLLVDGPEAQDLRAAQYLSGMVRPFIWDQFIDLGLDPDGAYVTGGHKFWPPYPRMGTIPAVWLGLGRKHLLREIELARPEYILVFGARPLKLLLGSSAKVYSFGGSLIRYVGDDFESKLIAFNNLYYLHRYSERALPGFHAAVRAVTVAEGVDKREAAGDYRTVTDEETLTEILRANDGEPLVAIDCEWHGESPNRGDGELLLIQFSFRPGEAYVIVLHSRTSDIRFAPSRAAAVNALREYFRRNPGITIIGQNLRADQKWLEDVGLDLSEQYADRGFDAMLAAHLLAEEDEHDLTALTMRYTDMGRYDQTAQFLLDNQGMTHSQLPDDVFFPYAAADVDSLQRMYPVLKGRLLDNHRQVCKIYGVDPADGEMSVTQAALTRKTYIPSLWNLFKYIVMPANRPIREVEREGLLLDAAYCNELTKAYRVVCDFMLEEIRHDIGDPAFNPGSTIQLRELYFSDPIKTERLGDRKLRMGKDPLFTTGKPPKPWYRVKEEKEVWWTEGVGWESHSWQPSLDDDTLAAYADEGCVISAKIRDYRLIRGLLSRTLALPDEESKAYEDGFLKYLDRDNKIRTSILQLSKTGRWRSFNPNCQNLPKSKEARFSAVVGKAKSALASKGFPTVLPSVRSTFVAEDGGLLLEWDLQSAELWTNAYWGDDPVFKETLNQKYANGDPVSFHTASMIKFFRLPYTVEEVDAVMAAGGAEGKKLKMWRTATKTINFGIPYGRGAAAIQAEVQSYGIDCSREDAEGWLQAYKDTFHVAWDKLVAGSLRVWDPGFLVNPYGRIRHFQRVDDDAFMAAQEREALNYPIQSTVADFINDAADRFVRERDRLGLRTRLKLAIHDALMAWVPYGEIKTVVDMAQWVMVDAPGAEVPGIGLRYGVDLEVNKRWNEKIDPWFLYDVSSGALDRRPACKLCGERIAAEGDKREIVKETKRITVCARCAI